MITQDISNDILTVLIEYYQSITLLEDAFDKHCKARTISLNEETQTINNTTGPNFAVCCGQQVIENGMRAHWEFVIKSVGGSGGGNGGNMGIGVIHKQFSSLCKGMVDKKQLI